MKIIPTLSQYLNIQKTKILAKEDCSVIINENEYKSDNDFIEFPDHFYLPGVFEIFIKCLQTKIKGT